MRADRTTRTWAAVFDGLQWPLEPWQLLTAADEYGVSPGVSAELARVAQRPYRDLAELERALRLVDGGHEPARSRTRPRPLPRGPSR